MGGLRQPLPVKLVAGLLTAHTLLLPEVRAALEIDYGRADFVSEPLAFTQTSYYDKELGTPIWRQFIAFEALFCQSELAKAKRQCNQLERRFLEGGRRLVNVDPGYITPAKLVLATTKDNSHRIYIGSGIYAEVTLSYYRGQFVPWPWTYPDYALAAYGAILSHIRATYMVQLKHGGQVGGGYEAG